MVLRRFQEDLRRVMVLGKLYTMMTKPVPVTLISLKMRQQYEASKAITVARTAMRTTRQATTTGQRGAA